VLTEAYVAELCAAGLDAGLDRVGVATAEPFVDARHLLEERAAAGLAATMQFTYRNPARSTDPSATLPEARSLVVGARSYAHEVPPPPSGPAPARVARYAATDHYADLRRGLDEVSTRLRQDGWATRVLLDDNALVDRAAAHRAGLGWYGKNAQVLVPGLGSWVVLGSVLTDADLPPTSAAPVADGCGACRRCLDACPTGAIVAPGVVDARRCLAWLVQAEGPFPSEHREALGDRLYGCDDCQEVCPPSRLPRAMPGRAGRAAADDGPGDWVDVVELLGADDADLMARYGRWYVPRRDPRYLRRNALVVLGNTGHGDDPAVASALVRALGDRDALVRSHAVWAARRLGRADLLLGFERDPDPAVQAELERPVELA
jgi:epoxyqueuosine reductase